MKTVRRMLALALVLSPLFASTANAITFCTNNFAPGWRPYHPSSADVIQITGFDTPEVAFLNQDFFFGTSPGLHLMSQTSTYLSISLITIDIVITTHPERYLGYQSVPVPLESPVATIGPLPARRYAIRTTLHIDSDAAAQGPLISFCPLPPSADGVLTVDAQPYPTTRSAVIEYYSAELDHYFMTADTQEISDLDQGVHPGWERTGISFDSYQSGMSDGSGVPVARFYGLPQYGLDTHFYTASRVELYRFIGSPDFFSGDSGAPKWLEESHSAFEIALPDFTTGECIPGTAPVYRLWNGRADSNHRYTTSLDIRQTMINQGWVPEGYGPDAVAMCAVQ